jgi:outer membrane receptor protein involved in Fe transport
VKLAGGLAVRDYGHLYAGGRLGEEAPSAYTEVNGDVRAAVPLGTGGSLNVAYQNVHQSDVPRFDQVRQRGFARYAFDPQVRQLAYARWSDTTASRWAARVEATASWQRSHEGRERQRVGQALRIEEDDQVTTWGASLQALAAPFPRIALRYGADLYHDRVRSSRLDVDTATGASVDRRGLYPDNATAWSAAAFAHATWERGAWRVEGGARHTATGLEARDATFGALDLGPAATVGHAAASVALPAGLRAYAQASQSFRAPNLDDVSALGSFDFGIEVPSPDLSPERGVELEGGLKWRARRASAAVAAYRLRLSDLIDRVRSSFEGSAFYEGQAVYQRANVGEALVRGIEAEGQVEVAQGWLVRGHVTGTRGEVTTTGQPMRRIPPLNGLLAVRRQWRRGWVEGVGRAAAAQRRLAPGDRDDHRIAPGGTPGWATLDLRGGVTLNRTLSLVAALENLTDEAYRIHGSGIDEPGRHAWVGVQAGW